MQPRPAGDPPAGREDQRAAGHIADQFQGRALRLRQVDGDPAPDGADIEAARYNPGDGQIELPVKLKVHDSIFVPLAKWAMLLTGNYRCVTKDAAIESRMRCIATSRLRARSTIGSCGLCEKLGASPNDLVPFEKYAAAANDLVRPSSAARALNNGVPNIERTDRLVQLIGAAAGMHHPVVDRTVALVDERLAANRQKAAKRRQQKQSRGGTAPPLPSPASGGGFRIRRNERMPPRSFLRDCALGF